jgi:glutathione S-transferase
MTFQLVIGNRNYSSWSLRAWLFLRESGIAFEEIRIPLFTAEHAETVARYSPTGRVPVLLDGDLRIWDTMSIFEYVRERHPGAVGWPADVAVRAEARSIAAEMHSGFLAIRDELPLNVRLRRRCDEAGLTPGARKQIERVRSIWGSCRQRFHDAGPWLFGGFSIADVMYAPMALRFVTYEIPVPSPARSFIDAVTSLPAMQEWIRDAAREPERLEFLDAQVLSQNSPLTLG